MAEAELTAAAISSLANILMALAACAAAVAAFMGLSTWKSQFRYKVDHDLARRALLELLRYKDAIAAVRHPAIFTPETSTAMEGKIAPENPEQQEYEEFAAVYEKRWKKVTRSRNELYPILQEIEAVWGQEARELFSPLFKLEIELLLNIRAHIRVRNPRITNVEREAARKRINKPRDVLYGDFDEEDSFNKDFNLHQAPLEEFLRNKLDRLR